MAVERTPVGQEETQIGEIEELMATPERRVKRKGEAAVVVRSSGQIESDWIIENFDPETGAATVSKRDERGKLLRKEIPREDFMATNFFKSEEMLGALNLEEKRIAGRTIFGPKAQEAQARDVGVLREIKEAFAGGDVGPMRDYFGARLKELEARFKDENQARVEKRRQALKDIEKFEKELALAEKQHVFAKNEKERQKFVSLVWSLKNSLGSARAAFREAEQELQRGFPELDTMRDYVAILDKEIARREKRAA